MKRYHMIVEGRVQGVGFRSFCMQQALTYNLTGSVRNMENGMVEIFARAKRMIWFSLFIRSAKETAGSG